MLPIVNPLARQHFAKQHIESAIARVSAIADKRMLESEENQRTYERFYNSLALFSSGTVALSVTYLGYLKSLSAPVLHKHWLMASWISLFTCLVCSLFYGFFSTHYAHFYRSREHAEALKKRYQTEIDEMPLVGVENLKTKSELEAFMAPRKEEVIQNTKYAKYYERRQNFYHFAWLWAGRSARAGFLTGLGLLVAFAIKNM